MTNIAVIIEDFGFVTIGSFVSPEDAVQSVKAAFEFDGNPEAETIECTDHQVQEFIKLISDFEHDMACLSSEDRSDGEAIAAGIEAGSEKMLAVQPNLYQSTKPSCGQSKSVISKLAHRNERDWKHPTMYFTRHDPNVSRNAYLDRVRLIRDKK